MGTPGDNGAHRAGGMTYTQPSPDSALPERIPALSMGSLMRKDAEATSLYRHFDKDGALLYVGVSLSAVNRLSQHKDGSHWFDDISSVTIEKFQTRQEALCAERTAIQTENPKHNIQHKGKTQLFLEDLKRNNTPASVSRSDLVSRITRFDPMYSLDYAASELGVPVSRLKSLISEGKIGYVKLGEKQTRFGVRDILAITGWQLIEYIEHLESHLESRKRQR